MVYGKSRLSWRKRSICMVYGQVRTMIKAPILLKNQLRKQKAQMMSQSNQLRSQSDMMLRKETVPGRELHLSRFIKSKMLARERNWIKRRQKCAKWEKRQIQNKYSALSGCKPSALNTKIRWIRASCRMIDWQRWVANCDPPFAPTQIWRDFLTF